MFVSARARLRGYLRTAYHARSLRTAWHLCTRRPGLAEVHLPGFSGSFRLRRGTSDVQFLRALVSGDDPPEYALPPGVAPRVILDIGANIGAVTAAFVRAWPAARIYAFEPLPENVALLRHNLRQFPSVTVAPYGLGAVTGVFAYERSDDPANFGGGGFHGGGDIPQRRVPGLPVMAVSEALAALGLQAVDVIKIDTEGAEHEILTSFPLDVLTGVQAIVGELHRKPNDAALLSFLARWFELDVQRCPHTGAPRYFRATPRPPALLPHRSASLCAAARCT